MSIREAGGFLGENFRNSIVFPKIAYLEVTFICTSSVPLKARKEPRKEVVFLPQ